MMQIAWVVKIRIFDAKLTQCNKDISAVSLDIIDERTEMSDGLIKLYHSAHLLGSRSCFISSSIQNSIT